MKIRKGYAMKKAFIVLLAAAMISLSCACTKSDEPASAQSAASSSSSVQESAEDISSKADESYEQQSENRTESSVQVSEASKEEASVQESSSAEQSTVQTQNQSSSEGSAQQNSSREPAQQSSSAPESTAPVQQFSTVNENIQVTGVALDAERLELYAGGNYALKISIIPENASDRALNIEWSDDSVISVSSDGIITAKSAGNARITVSSLNGKKAVCDVTVMERPAVHISQEPQKEESSTVIQKPAEQSEESRQVSQIQQDEAVGYVGAEWFNDAVFVGDSVTLKLSYYAENGSLGNADFLCAGSLGWNNALWALNRSGNVHPTYYGRKYTVDEGVRASGKSKVFIMLGMNDIGLYGVDGAANAMITLTDRIKQKSPGVQIYIESVTPMLKSMQKKYLNNSTISRFNSRLREICSSRGYYFLDVASVMKDNNGDLEYENCSDPTAMGIHFTDTGCRKWVDYLKRHVSQLSLR